MTKTMKKQIQEKKLSFLMTLRILISCTFPFVKTIRFT